MLPVINDFVSRYTSEDFIVVADSCLMNGDNVSDLEALGYKYIIGAKKKTELRGIREWILSLPKRDGHMAKYEKGNCRRLLVSYSEDRARKDGHNREKGAGGLIRHTGQGNWPRATSTSEVTTSS